MLEQIKTLLKDIFVDDHYGVDLEAYIISKNPQTVADVEYYTKQYEKEIVRGIWAK